MTGSTAIDIVIGLIFIYLLYSLLVTIVGEMIATWIGLRARILRLSLERLLNDDQEYRWSNILASYLLYQYKDFEYSFAGRFYETAIKFLAHKKKSWLPFRHSKPSFISADKFADIIIHLLRSKGEGESDADRIQFAFTYNTLHIQPETLIHFKNLFQDAGRETDAFREQLKSWFNESNDRATGWYKRKLQLILFWLGFAIAAAFNVDSIGIVKQLAKDKAARDQLVQLSIQASDSSSQIFKALEQVKDTTLKQEVLAKTFRDVQKSVNETNAILGLGWRDAKFEVVCFAGLSMKWYNLLNPFKSEFWGLILTALALSLGSPFWFDLLKKLVSIRGTGIKPEEKEPEPTAAKKEPSDKAKVSAKQPVKPAVVPTALGQEVERIKKELAGEYVISDVVAGYVVGQQPKQKGIEVYVNDQQQIARIKARLQSITSFLFEVHLEDAKTHQAEFGEQIFNQNEVNGIGTLGCFARKIGSNKIYLVSCWHVIKGDRSWFERTGPIIVRNNSSNDLAHVTDGTLTTRMDIGFAEMTDSKVVNSPKLESGYRVVKEADADKEIPVQFIGGVSGLKKAVIFNHHLSKSLQYPDEEWRTLEDLFSITVYTGNGLVAPSLPGDSGALVTDAHQKPLGIVVGGDSRFTYVAKLSNIISPGSLYDEYSILKS